MGTYTGSSLSHSLTGSGSLVVMVVIVMVVVVYRCVVGGYGYSECVSGGIRTFRERERELKLSHTYPLTR